MYNISKYHGCGNNFVIMQEAELAEQLGVPRGEESAGAYAKFAARVCDESVGIGADGFIIVRTEPVLEMVFFNRDGSRAPMCGNGIRCFAHYCRDHKIRTGDAYPVKTLAGDMVVEVKSTDPFRAQIDMGCPIFEPAAVCVESDAPDLLELELSLKDGNTLTVSSLFMGTIHTVLFVDEMNPDRIEALGEEICNHPTFAEKTNVNFVKVLDDHTLQMITYERGVGMTQACGTGACASVVTAARKGLCSKTAEVILPLGSLKIEIKDDGHVMMEGPSVHVLEGKLY